MGSAFPAEPREWFSDEDLREAVMFSFGDPTYVHHQPHEECSREEPHPYVECGRFARRVLNGE